MPELNLVTDLAKVQAGLPSFHKDAKAAYGKYITLDQIMEKVLPLLSKNNFAWVTKPSFDDGGNPTLEYSLMHISGEKIEGRMFLMAEGNNPQKQGSALTYARRYSIVSVLGITADEDDDGNAGSQGRGATIKSRPQSEATEQSPAAPAHVVSGALIKQLYEGLREQGMVTSGDKPFPNARGKAWVKEVLKKDRYESDEDLQALILELETLKSMKAEEVPFE